MGRMTKDKWQLIYKIIIAILTGIGGTLGMQSMTF